jgi:hypothetical protein
MTGRIGLTLALVLLCSSVRAESGGGKTATLRLQTSPTQAQLLLDDEALGSTPLVGRELPQSLHRLTIKKDGFVPLDLQVFLPRNETMDLGTIPLAERDTQITLWRVGSPHDGGTPPARIPHELEDLIQACGFRVRIRSFSATAFAGEFARARNDNGGTSLPDVVAGNNFLPFQPLAEQSAKTPLVSASGVLTLVDPFVFLVPDSRGHAAARQVALVNQVMPGPRFSWSLDEQVLKDLPGQMRSRDDRRRLEDLNCRAVAAYLGGNLKAIASLLHEDMPDLQGPFAGHGGRVSIGSIRTLATFGNSRLAFVPATASFWNEKAVGCTEVLSVWVRSEEEWSLLTITNDPISLQATRQEIPKLAAALTENQGEAVKPAGSLAPLAGLPQPRPGERFASFQWTPSPSKEVLAEVAEFNYGRADRLFFQPGGNVSTGQLWMTGGPWSWRVWSIGKDGRVVTSEVGRFQH